METAFTGCYSRITGGVTSDFLFPVAVGASAITTFTTPYLIRCEPFMKLSKWWERCIER